MACSDTAKGVTDGYSGKRTRSERYLPLHGGTLQILLENHRLHNLVYPTKRKIIFSLLEIATRSSHRAHKRVSEHTRQLQVSRAEAFSAE